MKISPKALSLKPGMGLAALTALTLACLAPQPVRAQTVVSSTNVNVLSTAPPSVVEGQITSDTKTTAFQEKQNLTLLAPLTVDVSSPGTYNSVASLTPSTIAAGTKVNSFLFYSDPTHNSGETFTGSITLDSNILGLEVLTKSLDGTDARLGALGTAYPATNTARGLEFSNGQDSVTLAGDDRTLRYSFHTTTAVDEIRIITAPAVPEASTTVSLGLLLAMGLGGMVIAKKRKQSA